MPSALDTDAFCRIIAATSAAGARTFAKTKPIHLQVDVICILVRGMRQIRIAVHPPDGEAVDLVFREVSHENVAQLDVVTVDLLQSPLLKEEKKTRNTRIRVVKINTW